MKKICSFEWTDKFEVDHECERLLGHKEEHVCYCGECKENRTVANDIHGKSVRLSDE